MKQGTNNNIESMLQLITVHVSAIQVIRHTEFILTINVENGANGDLNVFEMFPDNLMCHMSFRFGTKSGSL